MIGAYYETRTVTPIAMGALEQSMSDVALSVLQNLLSSTQPIVTVIPWATEDGQLWVPNLSPENRYALYAIDGATLDSVQRSAFGQPLGFVAIYDGVMRASPESLFDQTPWEFFQSQAVFNERDPGEPPVIRFLYWGKLRDDLSTAGSAATLEAKAKAAGADLVFPATLPIEGAARSMPIEPFDQALKATLTPGSPTQPASATAPLPGGPSPASPASPATPGAAAASGWGSVLLLASIAAVGGYIAYRVARKR